jgi:mRNA interferase MazF
MKISQVRTIAVERLGARVARATIEELDRVVEGLTEIVG